MISILIPVFNFEIVSLINELSRQLDGLNIEGEILVYDDGSSLTYRQLNKPVVTLKNVIYKELNKNYGRTGIREILASDAKHLWLLFLDCDSRIVKGDFLSRYVSAFTQNIDVLIGGRIYPDKPLECYKKLHWKYGVTRESPKGNKAAFHTNNFCIKKQVFMQINFPGFLNKYGHEDTWMGIELERLGKSVQHINNAVEHLQIENTEGFLKKTEQALQNLLLISRVVDKEIVSRHVSLFKAYSFINNSRLTFAVNFVSTIFKSRISQNLNSCNPSLLFFDLYRLHRLIQISKTKLSN